MNNNNNNNKAATAAKYIGIALFALGIFFTIGVILVLPFFFVIMFVGLIVIGIILIRWGNKRRKEASQPPWQQ
jgi:hypothetical protein